MNQEQMKKASHVYFTLLKEKIIERDHEAFQWFYEPGIREMVFTMADASHTKILEAHTRLHLVAKADGSLFATNFTQLKEKHSQAETKKVFHLMSMVIMLFLAEMDRNEAAQLQIMREGMTIFVLVEKMNELMSRWHHVLNEKPEAEKDYYLDMSNMLDTWMNLEAKTENAKGKIKLSNKSRAGLVLNSMKMLETEGLVTILDRDHVPKIIPKYALNDRMDALYRDYDRFQEIKKVIEEERTHA